MPLHTQIVRDGETLKVSWGLWHVNLMVTVAAKEDCPELTATESGKTFGELGSFEHEGVSYDNWIDFGGMFYALSIPCRLYQRGEQEISGNYRFIDPADGEVFELKAGDVLRMWRH